MLVRSVNNHPEAANVPKTQVLVALEMNDRRLIPSFCWDLIRELHIPTLLAFEWLEGNKDEDLLKISDSMKGAPMKTSSRAPLTNLRFEPRRENIFTTHKLQLSTLREAYHLSNLNG